MSQVSTEIKSAEHDPAQTDLEEWTGLPAEPTPRAEHAVSDRIRHLNAGGDPDTFNVIAWPFPPRPKPQSALDRPLSITLFDGYAATVKHDETASLREMVPALQQHTAPAKADLPWLKLATFGDRHSAKGSLRHDSNVLVVSGIEADYDGERVSVADACAMLRKAGLAALLYTSPSHTEAAPRWRALCPLAADLSGTPDELHQRRAELVGRLNGVLGGALKGESFALSQAFYWGSVNSNPAHRVELVEGDYIDLRPDLPSVGAPAGRASAEHDAGPFDWDQRKAPDKPAQRLTEDEITRALSKEGDRSAVAAAFIRRCLKANYTPAEIADTMMDHDTADRPVMGHYGEPADLARVRADVQRIAGKPDPIARGAEEAFSGAEAYRKATQDQPDDEADSIGAPRRRSVRLIRGSDVQPKAVRWLWPGWLAHGKLHLLAGTAGDGKSTIAFDLAATITRGGKLPDGSAIRAGSVIIWSGEDDFEDTILPRFLACGGDPTKLYCVGNVQDGEAKRQFDPATDLPGLADCAADVPDLALIIADPVVMVVTGDSHKNTEVRRGLQPLVNLANDLGVGVLGITHFRKDSNASAVQDRVVGSLAFGAMARLVMVTAKGADATAPRVLARAKSNIGPDGDGFFYTLSLVPVPDHAGLTGQAVAWGAAVQGSAKEILDRQGNGDRPTDDVKRWLMRHLVKGPVPVLDIKERAQEAGMEWKAVANVRNRVLRDLVTTGGDAFRGYTWSMKPGEIEGAPAG